MTKTFALGAATAILAGCAGPHVSPPDLASPTVSVPSANPIATQLLGKWMLVRVDGNAVAPNQLIILFNPKNFRASINCNTAYADYSMDGDVIMPHMTVTTEIGCNPAMPLDAPLTRILERRMSVALPNSLELILGGAHKLELRRVS